MCLPLLPKKIMKSTLVPSLLWKRKRRGKRDDDSALSEGAIPLFIQSFANKLLYNCFANWQLQKKRWKRVAATSRKHYCLRYVVLRYQEHSGKRRNVFSRTFSKSLCLISGLLYRLKSSSGQKRYSSNHSRRFRNCAWETVTSLRTRVCCLSKSR